MKKSFIFAVILLSGCSAKPIQYDLTGNYSGTPISVQKNIPNISVSDFIYEPHRNISQYVTSSFGCLFCNSDGSSQGFVYQQPIKNIIQSEVDIAFREVSVGKNSEKCSLTGQIHAVGWDQVNGDTTVDLTYILKIKESAEYVKRIRSVYDAGIFEFQKIDKFWAKPIRQSVQELVLDNNFTNLLNKKCI